MSTSFTETGCKYNQRGIVCDKNRPCEKCGWQPEEWQYRIAVNRMKRLGILKEEQKKEART